MAFSPLRCPAGHASYTRLPARGDYYCPQCDAHFDEPIDLRRENPDPRWADE